MGVLAKANPITWAIAAGLVFAADGQVDQRLHITNGCQTEDMWIAHMAGGVAGPDMQNVKLNPGQTYKFSTPSNLQSTRYWPKLRCNADGNKCLIGESGGPGETCDDTVGCAPPVDTKFEATFGTIGQNCTPSAGSTAGCDWVDISMVDGFTVPFKLSITGDCMTSSGKVLKQQVVDCSALSYDSCPSNENVDKAGALDLKMRHPKTNQVFGCYSPCSKLTLRSWNNVIAAGHTPNDDVAAPYCCPTPPESPEACRTGPVGSTQYVQAVHKMCPGVYGYAYDDGMGLMTCQTGTIYDLTLFCPTPDPGPSPAPAPPGHCEVGDAVMCPATSVGCAGNSCCPDGSVCPSASKDFKDCPKPKTTDCTAGLDIEQPLLSIAELLRLQDEGTTVIA